MNNNTNLPEVLTVRDLQSYLHISRAGAYQLLSRADFPTLHVGKRKLVTKQHLMAWIEKSTDRNAL